MRNFFILFLLLKFIVTAYLEHSYVYGAITSMMRIAKLLILEIIVFLLSRSGIRGKEFWPLPRARRQTTQEKPLGSRVLLSLYRR